MGALRWDAEGWQNSSPTAKFRRSFEAGHATRPQIAEHAGEPDGWLAPCPGIDPARRRPPDSASESVKPAQVQTTLRR